MELAKRKKLRENGGEERSSDEALPKWSSLLPELMTEILLRSPTRSVGRFRCVSKPFCSLLSEPKFAKNHLDLILQNDVGHRRLILYLNHLLFSVDFVRTGDGCEGTRALSAVELNLDLLCKMKDETGTYMHWVGDVTIVGSANGLVCTCCTCWGDAFLFLYNPTTGESKQVPQLPQSLLTELPECLRNNHTNKERLEIHIHGFAFDALADDYKVVKVVLNALGFDVAYVYSFKLDSWRQIRGRRYKMFFPTSSGVHLNGAFHWIAYLGQGPNTGVVAAFDVTTEEFREVSLPDEAIMNYPRSGSQLELGILKGRLCVAYSSYELQHDYIWVMNEYGLESSWTKIQLSMTYKSLKPICSTKNDEEVLLVLDQHLVLYNFESNTSRNLEIQGVDFGSRLQANMYIESLISPNSYGVES